MSAIKKFEDIQAWQKARTLVKEIYSITADGPASRDYGYRDQIRRAAVSVMSNIAEGYGRGSDRDFAHFLNIARGSAVEVQSLLYVGKDISYLNEADFQRIYQCTSETLALIVGFTKYLYQPRN